ncbi:DUF4232 domain-containing protein [Streptomyces sp. NRRL S-337]|uniref:DUF4232 domain-containing protein n=1 Tax=Streptomyces sp. NRRL S-337 TaxID=1463900 RepID=UPI000A445C0F|nr:DUF4232 domain-containing protein [Streptomyces sp. NRRL S-337]
MSADDHPVHITGLESAAPTPAESRCHSTGLRASVGPNHPGAGQENLAVVLTNGSHRTCTVDGFPGLAFVDGAGQAVTRTPSGPPAGRTRVP